MKHAATPEELMAVMEDTACRDYHKAWLAKFVTADDRCLKLKAAIRRLLVHPYPTILITGPSGHGKELLARALHMQPTAPFVAVNMAALPATLLPSILFGHVKGSFTGATDTRPGVFEAAGSGTVFLDEIGDMPEDQQPALLRVLAEREVYKVGATSAEPIHCRVVAATNRPAELRPDLMGRLMAVHLDIPPLLQRPDDLRLIAESLGLTPADYAGHNSHIEAYGVRYLQALSTRKTLGL